MAIGLTALLHPSLPRRLTRSGRGALRPVIDAILASPLRRLQSRGTNRCFVSAAASFKFVGRSDARRAAVLKFAAGSDAVPKDPRRSDPSGRQEVTPVTSSQRVNRQCVHGLLVEVGDIVVLLPKQPEKLRTFGSPIDRQFGHACPLLPQAASARRSRRGTGASIESLHAMRVVNIRHRLTRCADQCVAEDNRRAAGERL